MEKAGAKRPAFTQGHDSIDHDSRAPYLTPSYAIVEPGCQVRRAHSGYQTPENRQAARCPGRQAGIHTTGTKPDGNGGKVLTWT